MIRYLLIFVCGIAFGVCLLDTMQERAPQAAQVRQAVLGQPIVCDATVEQRTKPTERWSKKCYVAGMRK